MNAEDPTPDSTAGPVTAATERLIATASSFDEGVLAQPSLCPGWTRAHVLTHVARNADALANLLSWGRTGEPTPMYPSAEARDADIEAGARRNTAELVDDLRGSAARFTKAIMDMPDDGWERQVRRGIGGQGEPLPARRVLWFRLREVEIHHVDLDADYSPAHWPAAFVRRAFDETARSFSRREDVPPITLVSDDSIVEHLGPAGAPTVSGSLASLLSWLTGRSAGDDLRVEPAGPLPALPAWA